MDIEELVGKKNSNLVSIDGSLVHQDILSDWVALKDSAKKSGFELAIVSSFRSFDRQLQIWNDKVSGKRPVLDSCGVKLDISLLSDDDLLFSILKWSAIPGTSRHHWGTDLDVYDKSAVNIEYDVKLTDDEVLNEGVFSPLHDWLDNEIKNKKSFNFFRPFERKEMVPYSAFKKPPMISDERWHISHKTTSSFYSREINESKLHHFFTNQNDILLKDLILKNFENIYENFIKVSLL